MNIITAYEINNHGVANPQYYQGVRTSLTDLDNAVTGSGDTFNEALDDALEQIAQCFDDVSGIDTIYQDEKLDEKSNEELSVSHEEYLAVSNSVSPADYDDCALDDGSFCECCHRKAVTERIDENESFLIYYVSVFYKVGTPSAMPECYDRLNIAPTGFYLKTVRDGHMTIYYGPFESQQSAQDELDAEPDNDTTIVERG